MSLAERLSEKPLAKHGLPCSVAVILNTLEGEELEAFMTMLGTDEQRGWPASDIYEALRAEGHTVAMQSVNRHRGRRCRCAL